jgi:hypothetical protein
VRTGYRQTFSESAQLLFSESRTSFLKNGFRLPFTFFLLPFTFFGAKLRSHPALLPAEPGTPLSCYAGHK